MISDPMIHVRHIRQAGICMNGARAWFKARGWSWAEFINEGRPACDFIATGDPLAMRPVEAARKEMNNGR
jgi:hypothetical protein